MHVLDESTNIAANLHCLWMIFHLAFQEDNFTMHSGKFLRFETKQVPDVTPLTTNFWPTILAKVVAQLFLDITVLKDSSLLEIDC